MKRLDSRLTGIDQGSILLFSDFEDGGPMWTGKGPRQHRHAVTFSEPYAEPPAIHISMSMWDMDQKTNQRADIAAEDIGEKGFTIVFRTWGDTRVARVRADWTAIGPLPDPDVWDLY